MNKATQIATKYGTKTDLTGRLSYGNGVKNIVGVKNVNTSIRLRIDNGLTTDQTIYLTPALVLGMGYTDETKFNNTVEPLGVPNGVPFNITAVNGIGDEIMTISSLNRDQSIGLLASELNNTPLQIIGMSMRSFNKTTGSGEDSNYSNTVSHYNVSSLRQTRYSDLNLGDFQNSKDVTTSILKVDFLKNNFIAPVSQNDLVAFQVNAGTRIDVTFHIGARDSREERFFRDISSGTEMLLEEFPKEADKCSCS